MHKHYRYRAVLEIAAGHWSFSNQFQYLLYIFNGMVINNLQDVLSSKNGQPISDPYF